MQASFLMFRTTKHLFSLKKIQNNSSFTQSSVPLCLRFYCVLYIISKFLAAIRENELEGKT